ncbi:MAG: hypothetical protein KKA62_04820 [Nanoarchaeota archaeon]|nr:hypothetical protein [Nanoarchaeota archaeon]MBU1644236.1 hypothetical protein [Nanoarchaeota archaeon]MBU1977244.1 hypothetical protein [Nanoarchaeota archaeon]
MDPLQEHQDQALRQYQIAEHLLNSTLLLIKDSRLLIGIIHNLNSSLEHALDAILIHEIPKFNSSDKSTLNYKLDLFRSRVINKHDLTEKYLPFIIKIRELVTLHKKSPVEFKRGDKHVFCGEEYELKILSAADVALFLKQTKQFLEVMEKILAPI